MIRLYLDEDSMSRALVRALRDRGIDVTTAGEARRRGRSDSDQLAIATEQGRAIYTSNVADFSRLHAASQATGSRHTGVIVVARQRMTVGEQVRAIVNLAGALSAEEMTNRIEYLSNWL